MHHIDIQTATPEQLLRAQTTYLQEIHSELMRRKRREEQTRLIKWTWNICKYLFIIGMIWYFTHTVHTAIQNVRDAVPKLPEISLPSFG